MKKCTNQTECDFDDCEGCAMYREIIDERVNDESMYKLIGWAVLVGAVFGFILCCSIIYN